MPSDKCPHYNFAANVIVNRLEDTGGFMAEVRIRCTDCNERFRFKGLDPGLDMNGATVDFEGLEAHLAIAPESESDLPLLGQFSRFGVSRKL